MKELVNLSQYFSLKTPFAQYSLSENHLPGKLFHAIRRGEIIKDKDVKALWSSRVTAGASSKLKARLEDILINGIIVNKAEGRRIKEVSNDIDKKICAYKILQSEGKPQLGVKFLEDAYKKAVEFELTEQTFLIIRYLKKFFALNKNNKKYKFYSETYAEIKEVYDLECDVEDFYVDCLFVISGKNSFSDEDFKKIEVINSAVVQIPQKSVKIISLTALISIYYQVMNNDENGILTTCKTVLSKLMTRSEIAPKGVVFTLLFYTIPIYVKRQNYKQIEELIDQCKIFTEENSFNSLRINQYKIISLFHQEKYKDAQEVCNEVIGININQEYTELFPIYQCFASILSGNSIRTHKVLNDINNYTQDKEGMMFNLWILESINYLSKGEFDKLLDRYPAFERYAYRHLNNRHTRRQWFFAKALLSLEKANFKKDQVDTHSQKWIDKMNEYPMSANFELEFVPYNVIWKKVLEWLR